MRLDHDWNRAWVQTDDCVLDDGVFVDHTWLHAIDERCDVVISIALCTVAIEDIRARLRFYMQDLF